MPVLGSMVQYSLLHMFIGEYPMMCCSREGGVGNIWIRWSEPRIEEPEGNDVGQTEEEQMQEV